MERTSARGMRARKKKRTVSSLKYTFIVSLLNSVAVGVLYGGYTMAYGASQAKNTDNDISYNNENNSRQKCHPPKKKKTQDA